MLAYDYGARSASAGFHCSTLYDTDARQYRLLSGFVLRGNGLRRVTRAVREVERDRHGRPERIAVRGRDEDGTEFEAHGAVVSRFGLPSTPWFNWVSLVRWTLPDGSEAHGEDQETWSPERLRASRREHGRAA